MPITNNRYVAPTWVNNASPAINASELQAICNTVQSSQVFTTAIAMTTAWTDAGNGVFSQAVSVSGGNARTKVDIQPDETVFAQLVEDKVRALWVENNNGVFTAKAMGAAPTRAMSVQATLKTVVT